MPEHDGEREELLPFLANGTLDPEERAALERALAEDEPLRSERDFVARLRSGVKAASDAPDPGELPLRRALKRIEREQARTRRPSRWWRAAAIAASVVLLAQGVVIVRQHYMPVGPELLGARTAPVDARPLLQVRFAPEAREAEIRALLRAQRATIVDGPSAAGVYRVALDGVAPGDAAAIEGAIRRLAARDDVVRHVARE